MLRLVFGDEIDPHFSQFRGHLFGDIALVTNRQSLQFLEQFGHWFAVISVTGCQAKSHQFTLGIDYNMQLEPKEPSHGGFASLGNTIKGLVLVDALITADFDGRAVDIIKSACMSRLGFHERTKRHKHTTLHLNEPIVGQQPRKAISHLSANTIKIEVFEITIMAQVK